MLVEVRKIIQDNYDEEQSKKMAAYMKDLFPFAGIPKPKREKIFAPILKKYAKEPLDWEIVFALWNDEYREAQYVALGYLLGHKKELTSADLNNIKYLIINKSWWETVDTIDGLIGELVQKDEGLKQTMLEWATDENIWLRRVAIDFQQRFKEHTDTELMSQIIKCNLNSTEFFINKAIGWSLREYSKTDADWVREFIELNREGMSKLSVKEASKYL